MLSKTQITVMLVGAATLGCGLNNDRKDACNVASDCVDGLACVNHVCGGESPGPDGGPGDDGPDDNSGQPPDMGTDQYGAVTPLSAQTAGVSPSPFSSGDALLGATGVAGNLGCALVGDQRAAPGGEAALVYAVIRGSGSDHRCVDGTHAIRNDPAQCNDDDGLHLSLCAIYKRWDASGELVARRFAIGGFIAIDDVVHSEMSHTCNVELSIAFAGGATVQHTYSFDFNPFGSIESFCVQ